jgi:hypothetical protein
MSEENLASVLADAAQDEQINAEETAENAQVGDEQDPEAIAELTDEETPKEETPEQKHKRLSGSQRNKLKLQKMAQEIDFWREEALKGRSQPEKVAAQPNDLPEPPDIETYQGTMAEFKKELSEYREKLLKAQEVKAQKAAIERETVAAMRSFNERLRALPEFGQMAQTTHEYKMDPDLIGHIEKIAAAMPNGHEVLKEVLLADDSRDQLLRLAKLKDGQGIYAQMHAISRELLIASRTAKAEAKENEPPPETKAPRPPTTVRKPSGAISTEPLDTDDDKTWLRKREAQIRAKNGK